MSAWTGSPWNKGGIALKGLISTAGIMAGAFVAFEFISGHSQPGSS